MPSIGYACLTDCGQTHRWNEDRWFADPTLGLYIISDGMAVAEPARLVVDLLPGMIGRCLDGAANLADTGIADAIRAAVREVSEQVHEAALAEAGAPWLGLGATIVLALVRWPHALVAHLGDSRAYLLRDSRLEPLSRDHSLVEELVDLGKFARGAVEQRAFNGGPTRFAGMADEAVADTRLVQLQADDRLLLCSDGLTSMLSERAIEQILHEHLDPEAATKALVAAANDAGGEDNITVLVLAVTAAS